jgi:DNA-binding MarR family transcriptional regulator
MLQIAGARAATLPTISYVAERLGLRHHSVVELSKRCEEQGLIVRRTAPLDRRQIVLHLTAAGRKALEALSGDHARELDELAPRLIKSLGAIRSARAKASQPAVQREDLVSGGKVQRYGILRSTGECGCLRA